MNEEQWKDLVERATAGEQDAYTALYNATSQEVYQTVRSMVRDEHLALDIQQEAYVHSFTHLDQLEDPAKFPAWLRVIAVNQTRSELRKRTPILFTELEREDGSDVPEVPDVRPENSPELQVEQKETSKLVQDILAELTDSQRLLVGMYYYEQIPVTKIAADLGVSPGTVKTQLSRSRKKVETRVKALEAKGIKLYGLSPMPFLLALLKRIKPAEKAGKKVLAGAMTESGVAGETVAIHAGVGFFHTLAGKAVIAAAAAAVVAGGVAGYRWYQNRGSVPNLGDVQLAESVYPSAWDDTPEDYVIETDPETDPEETDDVIVTVEDSPEDMPEEPSDPTDPEPTDPDPTATESTQLITAPPLDSAGADVPVGPGSRPIDPLQPEPIPPTSESVGPETEMICWRWAVDDGAECYFQDVETEWQIDLDVYLRRGRTLVVTVEGDAIPEIKTDRADVIDIDYWGHFIGLTTDYKSADGVSEYQWFLGPCGVGTAHVYCVLNGVVQQSLTIQVPEVPVKIRYTGISPHPGENENQTLDNCSPGTFFSISVNVEGKMLPEIRTDNPSVIRLGEMRTYAAGPWFANGYSWDFEIIGTGEANIYVVLNGKTEKTFAVHSTEEIVIEDDSPEDLIIP